MPGEDTDRMDQIIMGVAFLALTLNVALGIQGAQAKAQIERDCLTAQRTTMEIIDLNRALTEISKWGDVTDRAIATARVNANINLQRLIRKCD